MPANYLVTGPPRSGKTTAVERTTERLRDRGHEVGGLYCPEVREGGDRVGFRVVDALGGESATLAHVDREAGPAVGKYRVDVAALDRIAGRALERARTAADVAVVDEVAPMEVESDAFVAGVRALLDAETPLVAAVHGRSTSGFVGEVKCRADAETFAVALETRDRLPDRLVERILDAVG